jgi:hypothetical protein
MSKSTPKQQPIAAARIRMVRRCSGPNVTVANAAAQLIAAIMVNSGSQ